MADKGGLDAGLKSFKAPFAPEVGDEFGVAADDPWRCVGMVACVEARVDNLLRIRTASAMQPFDERFSEALVGWASRMLGGKGACLGDAGDEAGFVRAGLDERDADPCVSEFGAQCLGGLLRAGLISTQLAGLGLSRYAYGLVAPDQATDEQVVDVLAPVLQHYLTEPLNAAVSPGGLPQADASA